MENNQRSVPNSPAPGFYQDERTTPPTAFHFPQQPQPMAAPTGYPMQAHVLVDPVTGQHYIVPQYYPPPMYPYPSGPAPVPQMYYPYGPPQPQPPKPPTTAANVPYTPLQPSYNPEEKEPSEDAMSGTSNVSRSSFTLQKLPQQMNRENSREYMYLHRSPTTNPPMESPLMRPKLFHQPIPDPRGGTQSDFETSSAPTLRVKPPTSSSSDHESSKRFSRTSFGTPSTQTVAPREEAAVRSVMVPAAKSVRMEINFDDVPTVPSEPKPTKKSTATAFTVNLGEEKEVSLQEAARTLAENRRKFKLAKTASHDKTPSTPEPLAGARTNKNYLLERLLTGKTDNDDDNETESTAETPEEHKDFDARSEALTFVIDTSKRPSAGMYGGPSHFQQQRVVQYSDDDDSDSDSEIMQQYSAPAAPPPPVQLSSPRPTSLPKPTAVLPTSTVIPPLPLTSPRLQTHSTQSTPRTSTPASSSSRFDRSGGGGSDFLQELAKLRLMAGLPAAGPTGSEAEQRAAQAAATSRNNFGRRSEFRAPTVSSTQKAVAVQQGIGERGGSRASFTGKTKETNTTPTPSRRSETRRSLTGNSSPQLSNISRPPFRTGAPRGIMIGQSEQQREQEMTAWLRRKDYNPMKAAAAGRKPSNNEVPSSRELQFQSRRSMTFHNTNETTSASPFSRNAPPTRPMPRNRSQEPRDAHNYRSVQKDQRLKRTVDMLSQKCKKSIELIRIQNKGCLSVSVEDLLSAAAEEPRPNESLDDQLDRLSDAFDAVQRYLEQYSLDGYNSPTPEDSRYFDDDVLDGKSTFSGVSTHQNNAPGGGESLTSSYRKKILES